MFGFKWPGKGLSDDDIRALLFSLVSTGCLLIAKTQGNINAAQNYLLVNSLYHWLNKQDGNEEHNKEVGYMLTDQLAIMPDSEDPSIEFLFNKGKQLDKELRILVIRLCMTFAFLDFLNQNKPMNLIGQFARDIGLTVDVANSLLPECIQDTGYYSVMRYCNGYEDSLRLLQKALDRVANNS